MFLVVALSSLSAHHDGTVTVLILASRDVRAFTTTTTTARLYCFTALLLLVERADKYTAIAPSSP